MFKTDADTPGLHRSITMEIKCSIHDTCLIVPSKLDSEGDLNLEMINGDEYSDNIWLTLDSMILLQVRLTQLIKSHSQYPFILKEII